VISFAPTSSMASQSAHHKREACRACGAGGLHLFLSLGRMPLANSFLKSTDEFADESFFPLDLYFCQNCSLVQLLDVIAPEILFRNYIYVTGTSDTIEAHNVQYANSVVDLLALSTNDLVVEIASNDGSLLKCFQRHEVRTLGVEPATNIAEQARARGVATINQFFSSTVARDLRETYGPAKVVIGNNVLAHVDETQDFLRGCRELLAEDGLVVIEVPYLRDLIERVEYDTVYHEHLCYFSVNALLRLFSQVGLSIVRVDHFPIHGGSLRIYGGRQERHQEHSKAALDFAEGERMVGLTDLARYEQFAADVERSRDALLELLSDLSAQGKQIAGYGAPAKGNTLLNYCGIDRRLLTYAVDKNPLKVGLYTPGTHIPVLPVSTLLERQPDYVLILAWNFAEEIIRQQGEYRARGGQFIIPVPQAKVV
jgi:C-methyltransferase-like protein/putative zinc binding protein/methyltransferase family protein